MTIQPKKQLETGIGRPTTEAWNQKFSTIFKSLAPSGLSLVMRQIPGVVYVDGPDLTKAFEMGAIDEYAETAAQRQVVARIGEMCAKEVLESDIALATLDEVPVIGVRLFGRKENKGTSRVTIVISDMLDPSDPNSYILNEERTAIAGALGLRNTNTSIYQEGLPKSNIRVGALLGNTELVDNRFRNELLSAVGSVMQLRPVGVVRAGSRE